MYNEALSLYEKAEEINPNLACYIQKAQLFSLLGDQQSMIAQYLKELSVNPKSKIPLIIIHLGKGFCFLNKKSIDF